MFPWFFRILSAICSEVKSLVYSSSNESTSDSIIFAKSNFNAPPLGSKIPSKQVSSKIKSV